MGIIWKHIEHRDRFTVSKYDRNRITGTIRNLSQTVTDYGFEEAQRIANVTGQQVRFPMRDGDHYAQPQRFNPQQYLMRTLLGPTYSPEEIERTFTELEGLKHD